jgi:GTP-binding protein
MVPAEEREALVKDYVKRLRWKGPVFSISALARDGLQPLLEKIQNFVAEQVPPPPAPPDRRFDAPAADTPGAGGAA